MHVITLKNHQRFARVVYFSYLRSVEVKKYVVSVLFMESVVNVASYVSQRYQDTFGERISEMKLHKLLYFIQRECIIQMGEPMFSEQFTAWKYGPVMVPIRKLYAQNILTDPISQVAQSKYANVFDFVFTQYAPKDAWSLSRLTHGELSWKNARVGLSPDENCSTVLTLADLQQDAVRAKTRRFIIDTINSSK